MWHYHRFERVAQIKELGLHRERSYYNFKNIQKNQGEHHNNLSEFNFANTDAI